MFCKECGMELPDDSKFCSKCGEPVVFENNNFTPKQNVGGENTKTEKPTVGGSFGYALIIEVLLGIIMVIIGEDTSTEFSLGTDIILGIIELVIITAIVHGFRRWKWDSKH